jgi:hypothetical protein
MLSLLNKRRNWSSLHVCYLIISDIVYSRFLVITVVIGPNLVAMFL